MSLLAPARPQRHQDAVPATTRPRDPWFDNAKMLLVTLVVVGHLWNLLPRGSVDGWLYDTLYLWHVPAFVMVTGYLSRSFRFTRRHLSRLVSTVVLPYVVFSFALAEFRGRVGGEDLTAVTPEPNWAMWYLTALFLWRLATPLLVRLPWVLPVSVVVSLAGGMTEGDTLDLARTLSLLPFFVIGLQARTEHVEMLRRPATRMVAAAAFALLVPVAVLLHNHLDTEWLYWRSSYEELGVTLLTGAGIRLMLLLIAAVLSVGFFVFVPRTGGWFARMGSATMVVYLFHGFVVKGVSYTPMTDWAADHELAGVVLFTLGAVLVALLLASPPVSRVLGVAVDPVGAWQRARRRQKRPVEAPGSHDTGTARVGTSSS